MKNHLNYRDVACNVSTAKSNENEIFQNKYRIPSVRLQGYDYSANGAYFVTICTANREHFLGKIMNGEMHLSDIGEIAHHCWQEIPKHFPFVVLGEEIIMPNHVHGIIIIDKTKVETLHATSLQPQRQKKYDGNSLQSSMIAPYKYSLSSIMRSYKSAISKNTHEKNFDFAWQPRYHDHIIRNTEELNRISEYIITNPQNWEKDDYFKQ